MRAKLKVKPIYLAAGLVLIAGVAALLWFLVLSPGPASGSPTPASGNGVTVEVGEFITNLAGESSRRILRLSLTLSVADKRTAKELGERTTIVKNEVLELLRSKQAVDLEGEAGMQQLGSEIVGRLNSCMGREAVLRAFFTDFIIQ